MRAKLKNNEATNEELRGLINVVYDSCATVLLNCHLIQISELRDAKVSIEKLRLVRASCSDTARSRT